MEVERITCSVNNLRNTTRMIGLSKNERPILDHHAKAHNFEIRRISCGFHTKSGRFRVKSGGFHADFMKSLVIAPTLHSSNWRVFAETLAFIILGGFHGLNLGEIYQISGWNLPDFKGEIHHPAFIKLKHFCWNTCFYHFGWISQVISGWNPPDFMGEIRQISRVKSARFHGWNPPDFKGEIRQISRVKSAGFHPWNQGWNPPDFERPIARNGKPYV